ncbi:MAG TPA: formate/nitrite transporter family protein [Acidobacteriaceae bacterium]|nr:formate/nitrite transporter family protein [Acidobacteriaceae bacterium]
MPLRKLVRNPHSEPPAAGTQQAQTDLERPTANEIYEQVSRNARHELDRPAIGLAISGLAGGITMGLTALSTSIALVQLGHVPAARFIADLLYPLGFIAVIVGRAQLFTENTLYPVALMLAERRHGWRTLRLWAIVFPSNVLGAFFFALLAVRTGALRPDFVMAMTHLGVEAAVGTGSRVFWSGVIGGWIIALVAWLVSGSHSITGSVMLIWLLTFVVGLGGFAHCIATSGEILAAILDHQLPASRFFAWLAPATLGNICGGVLLVTLLEYGQVKGGEEHSYYRSSSHAS